MNTVISMLLLFTYNSLNKDVYYYIAIYILDHLDDIENISIEKLAQDCHTSTVTIKKFCKLLGIDSFKKFKSLLFMTRKGRMEQIQFRYSQMDEEKLFNQIKYLSQKPVIKDQFIKIIDGITNLIHECNHIYITGATYPLALTLNFIEDMKIFNKKIYIKQLNYKYDDYDFKENDLILFITMTGRILSQNKQVFTKLYKTNTKKVIMTHNSVFQSFYCFDYLLFLQRNDDSEVDNLLIIEILNFIKYKYFMKYIKNNLK